MGMLTALPAIWCTLAQAQTASWIDPNLLEGAKKEGSLTVYSSINEEEALPIWKTVEQETGVKVDYVRGSDVQLIARIMIEARAGKQGWDLMQTPSVHKLPHQLLAPIDLPEARHALPEARDPNRRWQGVTAIYQTPAYNTKLVAAAELPHSHEEFAKRPQWAGRVAINDNDSEWIASSNYAHLTLNVKLNGGATGFFALDPVGVFFNEVGVSTQAAHPNAARLAANYLLSKPAQQQLTERGRVPTRLDVETNPPGMLKPILTKKLIPVVLSAEQEKRADTLFKELIAGRTR
jgi:iron(III) transport system substrate-binding protein